MWCFILEKCKLCTKRLWQLFSVKRIKACFKVLDVKSPKAKKNNNKKNNPLEQCPYMFSFVQACMSAAPLLRCTDTPELFLRSLVESTADSSAHDAASFTWQGVTTAVQCCSTLPSVALQQHSPSPAPTMHFRIINLSTCKKEMSGCTVLRFIVWHPHSGKRSAGHPSL